MERGQGGDAPGEAAAFLPIGHLLPSGGKPQPGFPCVSLEQTQMLREEMLSQKGLLGKKKCESDGAVGRDACSMLQPLLSAIFIYCDSSLSPLPTFQGFMFPL